MSNKKEQLIRFGTLPFLVLFIFSSFFNSSRYKLLLNIKYTYSYFLAITVIQGFDG